jgi:low temperature requirement protein LtrA
MSSPDPSGAAARLARPHRRSMVGRDVHEGHRVSTPLELLYDLTFVVAIALTAAQLHHAVAAHHLAAGLLGFVTTFIAVWWAWMAFTWFASAYDTDDAPYRLYTMVQMVGVLILAAGVAQASEGDFTTVTIGYVVMRAGMIGLWSRAAREHPERRHTALRYVWGILVVQTLWVARLALPVEWGYASWLVLILCEFAIPVWAAKRGHTPWHAHHISERYGLFTIIVLGECVLGATQAVAGVIQTTGWSSDVVGVGVGSTALVLALWWVYFLVPFGDALHHHRERAFRWGYGHFVVFASLAAMGAFLNVVADQIKLGGAAVVVAAGNHAPVSPVLAIGLVAGAVAIYLTAMWLMSAFITGMKLRIGWVWVTSLAGLAAVVALVAAGLPLPWALPLLALAPTFVVVMIQHLRGTTADPHPKAAS